MRVLHVHTSYRQPGGEDSVVVGERSLLRAAGHEVLSADFTNPTAPLSSALALAKSPWNAAAAKAVLRQALDQRPDVVHIHNTWFALSPAVVQVIGKYGLPVIMTFHNYRLVCLNAMLLRDGSPCELCVGGSPFPGVRFGCYRGSRLASAAVAATIQINRRKDTWRWLSAAIALTDFARDRIVLGGVPPHLTVVKPNFVDDPGSRTEKVTDSNTVLFVGRLAPEKGVDRLVHAWREGNVDGLQLEIVGDGPLEAELRASAPNNVTLLGRISPEEVKEKMLQARALFVPSIWFEGQPMVVLEALAAGLGVFHSGLGALTETCGDGGYTIGSGDIVGIRESLQRLMDLELVQRLGVGARNQYEAMFTPSISLARLEEIYTAALGSR